MGFAGVEAFDNADAAEPKADMAVKFTLGTAGGHTVGDVVFETAGV